MSKYTYNEFHLGDNLIHLHFLRRLALAHPEHVFIHAVHECHRAQLEAVVDDCENVMLIPLEQRAQYAPPGAWRNTWKNADGWWERHPRRHDWVQFHLEWFAYLAQQMGYPCPLNEPKDLLFDWPGIQKASHEFIQFTTAMLAGLPEKTFLDSFDFLIINSRPCSGQLLCYDSTEYLTPLIEELHARYRVVVTQPVLRYSGDVRNPAAIPCTLDHGLTLTDIGTLSLCAKHILAVATGPMWPTFNVWNSATVQTRVVLLEKETVALTPNVFHAAHRAQARDILVAKGLL